IGTVLRFTRHFTHDIIVMLKVLSKFHTAHRWHPLDGAFFVPKTAKCCCTWYLAPQISGSRKSRRSLIQTAGFSVSGEKTQ
ncbi:hypothetical protein, partial [Hungatella hathewayi]|uniref:hypothetical protein n=1 Tax=Hungatella hathewayi TaxID=154046 RepID=UPI00242A4BB7